MIVSILVTYLLFQIPTLNSSECKLLLRHSLKARKRTLTSSQEKLVTEAILQNPNPLYLQFVLREVCSWHSYLWNSNWTPPADLDGEGTGSYLHNYIATLYTNSLITHILIMPAHTFTCHDIKLVLHCRGH